MKGRSEAVFWLLCFTLTGINLVFVGSDEPCEILPSFTGQSVARLINESVRTEPGSTLICECKNAGEEVFQETLWRGPDRREITKRRNSKFPTWYKKQHKKNGRIRAILTIKTSFSCTNTGLYTCQIGMGNTREFFLTPNGETCIPQNVTINTIALSRSENGTTLNVTCTANNPLPQMYKLSYSWRINNVTDPNEKGKDIVVTVKGNPIVTCSVSNLVGTSRLSVQLIIHTTQSATVLQTTQPTPVSPTALTTATSMTTAERTPPVLTTSAERTPPLLTTSAEPTTPLLTTSAERTPSLLTTSAEHTPPLLTTSAERTPPLLTTSAERTPPLLTTAAERTPPLLTTSAERTPPLLTTSAERTPPLLTTSAERTPPLLTTSAEPTTPLLTTSAEPTTPLLTASAERTPPLLNIAAEPTPSLLTTSAEPTLLFVSVLSTYVPYDLTVTPTTFLSAAPPTTLLSAVPPTTFLSTAPPTTLLSAVPPTTFLSTAPPTTFLSTAPPTTLLSAAPPTTFLPTAPSTTFLSIAPPTPVPIITSLTSSIIETIPPPLTEVTTSTVIALSASSIIEMSITTVTEATSSAIIEPSSSITKSTTSTTMQPTSTTQPDPITIEPLQQSATNKSVNITLSWSLSETALGNQTVMYTWTSLWVNRVAKRDSSNRESVTVSKDARSHTVVDADGFSTYCFTISAEFGNYNHTTGTKCDQTQPTQPSEPIDVKVFSQYEDSALVIWEIPERPNGRITLFQVYINDNPVDQLEYGQYVTRKGMRVYQLQQGVTYTFKVSAINQAGEGVTSQAVPYTHRASQGRPPLSSGAVAALVIVIVTAFLLWLIIFGCIIFIYLKKQSESGSQDGKGIQIVSEEKGGEGSYVKTTTSKDDYVDSEDVDTKEAADETKDSEEPKKSQGDDETGRKDPLDVEVETEMVTVKFDDDSSDDPATSQRRFYSDTAV